MSPDPHCDDHSGHCIRLDHLESDVNNHTKKLDWIIRLVVLTLAAIIVEIITNIT